MKALIGLLSVAALTLTATADPIIFDNGGPDGVNGYSVGEHSFGWREVADDFVLGDEHDYWYVTDAHFSVVWNSSGGLGNITQVNVNFYEDTGAGPAMTPMGISPGVVNLAAEAYTGATYFGRQEVVYDVIFDPVMLASGVTYWISLTPMACPENLFWLNSNQAPDIFGNESYVDMEGLHNRWTPSSAAFGTGADMSFYLTGVPAPGALALLGLAGLIGRRRR